MMLQIQDLNDFIQHLKDEFSNLRASDIMQDVDDEFFSRQIAVLLTRM